MDVLACRADAKLGQGRHGGAGAGAAGPGLAAAAFPHPHLQVGGIHHLHEFGVDALREVGVMLERRADGFQLQAVHILPTVTQWGLPTLMQVTFHTFPSTVSG